jgi:hypothetical protein
MARNRWSIEEEDEQEAPPPVLCWLCERDMGAVTEWHHPIPKSRGGKDKVPVHPICHQAIHSNFTNSELGRMGDALGDIRAQPAIAKFLEWVANKPADFHAPTRNEGGKGGKRR